MERTVLAGAREEVRPVAADRGPVAGSVVREVEVGQRRLRHEAWAGVAARWAARRASAARRFGRKRHLRAGLTHDQDGRLTEEEKRDPPTKNLALPGRARLRRVRAALPAPCPARALFRGGFLIACLLAASLVAGVAADTARAVTVTLLSPADGASVTVTAAARLRERLPAAPVVDHVRLPRAPDGGIPQIEPAGTATGPVGLGLAGRPLRR